MGGGGLYKKQEWEDREFRSLCPILMFELPSALSFAWVIFIFQQMIRSIFCAGFGAKINNILIPRCNV